MSGRERDRSDTAIDSAEKQEWTDVREEYGDEGVEIKEKFKREIRE